MTTTIKAVPKKGGGSKKKAVLEMPQNTAVQNAVALAEIQLRDWIDECGKLEAEIPAEVRKKLKRAEALRSAIRNMLDMYDPTQAGTAFGKMYECIYSAKGEKQYVADKTGLLKHIGPEKFAELANFTIESLQRELGATALAFLGKRPDSRRLVFARQKGTAAD